MPVGIEDMTRLDLLPFLEGGGMQAHYEGSIDKLGGNADWDWWLYQDENGEWVIFDVDGPGCIYNFVQHRYPTCEEPIFRFYFDGELEPRFSIRHSEFGKKHPFIAPLAGFFEGDDIPPAGRGPIRVVRSFVPMPFAKSCKVTSSVKLEGCDRGKGQGGWGHIIYHEYATPEGVKTFTGKEDYSALLRLWNSVGKDPKPASGCEIETVDRTLKGRQTVTLIELKGEGSIASMHLDINPFDSNRLRDLLIVMRWDDLKEPAIECPLGALFGNEIGNNRIGFLTHGQDADGKFYFYFPMPYWKSAHIELQYLSQGPDLHVKCEFALNTSSVQKYPPDMCGHLLATKYYPATPAVPGHNSIIGVAEGRGHIVSSTLTALPVGDKYVSCEGDVELYIDDSGTPQIESDGSESHACYGWGFVDPPQQNPASGYDGQGFHTYAWSQARVFMGDRIPFQKSFRFTLEAGGDNDWDMLHSGLILYYGKMSHGMLLTDTLYVGNTASEKSHNYKVGGQTWMGELSSFYEGDYDNVLFTDTGRTFNGFSEFTVAINPMNNGIHLRRRCDQKDGRMKAKVYLDGELLKERNWYFADRNPHKRWLDHELQIPPAYTYGKEKISLRIEYVQSGDTKEWNEFQYWIYSLLN